MALMVREANILPSTVMTSKSIRDRKVLEH